MSNGFLSLAHPSSLHSYHDRDCWSQANSPTKIKDQGGQQAMKVCSASLLQGSKTKGKPTPPFLSSSLKTQEGGE